MIRERIKQIRKESKLTQEKFAEKIKISRANLTNIETGKTQITERNIKEICEKFNINEKWLKEGIGEMKYETEEETLERLAREKNLDEIDKEIIGGYIQLNEKERESVQKFILEMANKITNGEKKEKELSTLGKKEKKDNA